MRTKEEILKEEHYKKFSVFDEIFIDIRDQLKRIADKMEDGTFGRKRELGELPRSVFGKLDVFDIARIIDAF